MVKAVRASFVIRHLIDTTLTIPRNGITLVRLGCEIMLIWLLCRIWYIKWHSFVHNRVIHGELGTGSHEIIGISLLFNLFSD